MGAPRYKHLILNYFTERPGLIIHASELQDNLGLTRDQVLNAVSTLRKNAELTEKLQIIVGAYSWCYRPNQNSLVNADDSKPFVGSLTKIMTQPSPVVEEFAKQFDKALNRPEKVKESGKLFEMVGRTNGREIIVKDDHGNLYKLSPL